MAEIGIKELKSSASRVIEEVSGGKSYVVTKRGRAAAVIMPIESCNDSAGPSSASTSRTRC